MVRTGKTVLVVDDEADILQAIAWVLADAGYRVRTAGNGQEALQFVQEELPALILLDMKMPRMDGWQFAQQLRSRHDQHVPLVVLTAAENAQERAAEVGAEGYVSKPFELDELVAVVARHTGATG
jgi:CheY-like chemotaxis protein